ncbi:MAG: hypothetical protein R3268_08915 [Acidiferrobacterales bacterium]|nr:hypothetical protein [Acidiferrobacterales bacterium]
MKTWDGQLVVVADTQLEIKDGNNVWHNLGDLLFPYIGRRIRLKLEDLGPPEPALSGRPSVVARGR